MEISIWDIKPERIAEINKNLRAALYEAGMKANIMIMSEPPLVARMNLTEKVPLLEIDGMYWSLKPGETISQSACLALLNHIKRLSESGT